jgi:hypothetical protein
VPTRFNSYIFAVFSTDFTQLKRRAYFTVHFILFFRHFDVVFRGRLNSPTEVRIHISSIWIQIARVEDKKVIKIWGIYLSTVSKKRFKQKVITQGNDYFRVKGDILKVQNCNELKSSTLGFLRSLRSPRSNNLKIQNDENSK